MTLTGKKTGRSLGKQVTSSPGCFSLALPYLQSQGKGHWGRGWEQLSFLFPIVLRSPVFYQEEVEGNIENSIVIMEINLRIAAGIKNDKKRQLSSTTQF